MDRSLISFLIPAFSLWHREILRFFRQTGRLFAALAQALIFWLLMGSGFQAIFKTGAGSLSSMEFFYPGAILLTILFSSIFSSFSVIEDRKEGFLQGVLSSPAPRLSIVLGKVLGGATIATLQGSVFLLFAKLLPLTLTFYQVLLTISVLFLLSLGLSALGFIFAWKIDSTQSFHAIMTTVLFPLWFLSGALFPLEGTPLWLRLLMHFDPLTYHLLLLKQALSFNSTALSPFPLEVTLVFTLFTFGLAVFLTTTEQ